METHTRQRFLLLVSVGEEGDILPCHQRDEAIQGNGKKKEERMKAKKSCDTCVSTEKPAGKYISVIVMHEEGENRMNSSPEGRS